jgi:hypothetical protein
MPQFRVNTSNEKASYLSKINILFIESTNTKKVTKLP